MTSTIIAPGTEGSAALPFKQHDVASVYVSGPMTGLPEFNYPAFRTATAALRAAGYDAWCPTEHTGLDTTGMTGSDFTDPRLADFDLKAAFAEYARVITTDVDAVAVLPGWEHSKGARAEVALAQAIGKPILDALTGCIITPDLTVAAQAENNWPSPDARRSGGMLDAMTDPYRVVDAIDARDAAEASRAVPPAAPTSKGEVRTTSSTGGQKGTKEARFALIPPGPLWELAVLYGRGAEKYAADNWKKGYSWSLSYDALVRHLNLWWTRQEDHDEEMGTKHLINVAWHAFNLAWFMENKPEFDDRPNGATLADGTQPGEQYFGALPTPEWILDKKAQG